MGSRGWVSKGIGVVGVRVKGGRGEGVKWV